VALGEDWPFGQWSHGAAGVVEYYRWLLQTEDATTIASFLQVLAKRNMKGHWPCPCGSGLKIRRCCRDRVMDLRSKIPPPVAHKALETFGASKRPHLRVHRA